MFKKFFYILLLIVICIPLVTFQTKNSQAETVDELQTKIDAVEKNRQKLEKEIAAYQTQLKNISQEASTLQSSIKSLDVSTSKITSEVKLTETNINKTSYTIKDTNLEILDKEKRITRDKMAIRDALRKLDEASTRSVWEILLSNQDLADFWTEMDSIIQVQAKISEQVESIQNIKANLEKAKAELEKQKAELEDYNKELSDRKKVLDSTKKEKSTLLSVTKNTEANYQKILKDKLALKEALDREINDFESQIKAIVDPGSYPKGAKGILSWPLDNIFITQLFGRTSDSGRLYASGSHNGVDFRASVGTKVKSIGNGVVEGLGDTDIVCRGASYGKWVFIRYDNGLASTYGHLSVITATKGQRVKTGDVVGYSGNTGYSTGPHLHMSVYASQGVSITTLKSSVCSGIYTIPLASKESYLDPMNYLPSL